MCVSVRAVVRVSARVGIHSSECRCAYVEVSVCVRLPLRLRLRVVSHVVIEDEYTNFEFCLYV